MTLEPLTCFGAAAFWIKIDTIVSLHPLLLNSFSCIDSTKTFFYSFGATQLLRPTRLAGSWR